ncbi:MAG: chitobiase/beta-hexosaminidase C-terminal domain-containing protein [Bacteroidales bacterium]|nr:chitobiase/beta-hexosaminidase C-terminal domain-containing protein [Bacteroidales bacterium]
MEDALAANNNSLKNAVSKAETLNEGPTAETGKIGIARFEFVAPDDDIYYISSFNGDIYCSYIIVEANEVPGTPAVEVGEQTYENGLWYCEVSCTPQSITEGGETLPTVVTYTTDGTEPGISSPVYSAPIKCYKEQTIKFQAFYDLDGELTEDAKILNADNEANVSFSFDAPAITSDGGTFTVTSPYEGAKNFYSVNGADAVEGNGTTLTESATVTAYSQITNGEYATFTTASTSTDVYVLTAITSDQTISVSGTAIVDAEATAASTDGTVYTSEDAAVSADKAYFFVKNPTFGYIATADADNSKYQAPAGQEVYLQMSNTNITFYVADGDSIDITVTCSKNSCKDLTKEQNKDVNGNDSITAEHQCYVNLDGTNYGGEDLVLNPDGNVIKFSVVGGGYHTFQKYSGTGNIKISSIEFKYAGKSGINDLKSEAKKSAAARKVMINGRLYIETAKGTFNAAGLRVK